MGWQSGEGRLISEGRTVLNSDQIVLERGAPQRATRWHAYMAINGRKIARLDRRHPVVLELDDGRRGWFFVTSQSSGFLSLRSCGRFR